MSKIPIDSSSSTSRPTVTSPESILRAPKAGAPLRLKEIAQRVALWAFVGGIFGFLYLALYHLYRSFLPEFAVGLVAAAMAGAVGALVYSSMRLAVVVAIAANVVSVGTTLLLGWGEVAEVVILTGLAGAVIGYFYGRYDRDSHVFRADAKAITGLFAGGCAALAAAPALWLFGGLPLSLVTGFLAGFTGLVYISVLPRFVDRYSNVLPAPADGALAGGAVGVMVGLGLFVLGADLAERDVGYLSPVAGAILDHGFAAIFGGALGSAVVGFARALRRVDWVDL